jgi:predicted ribosome quality control (RQC) complex YloA/Tae2 family protein
MENQILNLLIEQLRPALVGDCVAGAYAAREGVVLLMERSPLFFCLRRELPILMAREQAEARQSSAAYGTIAARLRERLNGAALASVEKEPPDRLITFRFEHPERGGSLLYFAAIPRRVDLVLTDSGNKTIAALEAIVGEVYKPPSPPPGKVDLYGASKEELRKALGEISAAGELSKSARRIIKGVGTELSDELAARLETGIDDALEFLEGLRKGRFKAGLFAKTAGDDSSLLLLPGTYRHFAGEPVELFEDANDAAEILFRKRMRAAALEEESSAIAGALKKQLRRLKQLISNLKDDLTRSEKETSLGELGDLILINLSGIRKGLESIEVEDVHKEGGGRVTIALDPALDPADNAKRYYKRARKAKRAAVSIWKRLEELEGEQSELEGLDKEFDGLRGSADLKGLRALRGRLVEKGWLAAGPRKRGTEPIKPGRRFISSDGLEIVVGRNNRDNEAVTFGIGKEYDFWFHTAGYAGSHVLVRNPQRLKNLPPATMAEAASIAAYYSKARQSRNVQVHWTERRFLKKAKGGEPGKVLLTSYRSTMADPEIPKTVRVP